MGRFVSFAAVGVDPKVMGEFLFIFTWEIRLTACFVYRYRPRGGHPRGDREGGSAIGR